MSQIECVEVPRPLEAVRLGQTHGIGLQITSGANTIAVFSAVETMHPTGRRGFYASISKSRGGFPVAIDQCDIDFVLKLLEERKSPVPRFYEILPFTAGPFVGLGVHVWEAKL
jgi:hypothetical protein